VTGALGSAVATAHARRLGDADRAGLAPLADLLDGAERTDLHTAQAAGAGIRRVFRRERLFLDDAARQQRPGLSCRRHRLRHRLAHVLRTLRHPRQVHPLNRRLHRAELGMQLHVEAVLAAGELELFRQRVLRRTQSRHQHEQVGGNAQLRPQQLIVKAHRAVLENDRLLRRAVVRIPEELHARAHRLLVELLRLATVGADVFAHDAHLLPHPPQRQRLMDHRSATVARAPHRPLPRADARNEGDALYLSAAWKSKV